jgi:glycosyltransferase involved in cell wall biosynthesis
VDVVVNNFNYALFLGAAIDSALAQTYEHVHVIVVDDGSTDNSREVLASYGDLIKPVLKENGGQASALNAGILHSQSDIVIFLDADDVLDPHAAQRIAAAFSETPGLAKVQCRMAVMDEAGRRTGEVKPPRHIELLTGDLRPRVLRFPFDLPWVGGGTAYSVSVLRKMAPIPEDGPVGADWYLVHVSALLGPVGAVDEPLAIYRLHGNNWHEGGGSSVDLDRLRAIIGYTARTRTYIADLAGRLGLDCNRNDASMSEIADRIIFLKLDPKRHPIHGDTLARLVRRGSCAAARRFDINSLMKVAFIAWLLGIAIAPRRIARWLSELFLFPERRTFLNRLLRRLHLGQ